MNGSGVVVQGREHHSHICRWKFSAWVAEGGRVGGGEVGMGGGGG